MRTRRRGRSRAPTAPTRRCSRTTRSRRSTSRCRTRCTASGRSRRSRRASTCSARSRMSRHTDEVEAAFDAAERTGRLLSEAFMYRHNPQTKRAKQLVDDGAIGELRLVRSTFSYSLYDEDNIRLRTDVEGGALMDVGCYNVSGSRLFGGEPEHVIRRGVVRAVGHRLGLRGDDALPGQRDRALRLRHGDARARRARGDRQRGLALPRRPLALQRAGDRGSPRRRRRADRDRARGLLPARARERERRDPRRGASCCSAARTRSARRARSRRCTSRRRTADR